MKKISYASGLEGKQVIPIQALTCLLYVGVGLIATLLFLKGNYDVAFVSSMAVTQGWRILSEVLRADYRGNGKITAYPSHGNLSDRFCLGAHNRFAERPTQRPSVSGGHRSAVAS
jgi:hypothetical protein